MHRTSLLAALALALPGCSDSSSGSGDDDSGGILPPGGSTTGADTDTGTGLTAGEGDGVDETAGPAMPCETVACGDSAACCEFDQECVVGSCVPACASGVRCGVAQEICCDAGSVCLADACVAPTGACLDSFDCEIGEFCEPTLEQCLPQVDPVTCELQPQFEDIDTIEEWHWDTNEVISIPVVADLDGDGRPEVVVNTTLVEDDSWVSGEIVVLSGTTGVEQWRIAHQPTLEQYGSHGRHSIALGDVSGDGLPDIIYAGRSEGGSGSLVHAVDGNGTLLWSSHNADGSDHRFNIINGAASVANLDDDPEAEIVFGAAVIDDDGLVVWDEGGRGAEYGTNDDYTGGISALADLDGDASVEIVSGRHAWSIDWQEPDGVPLVTVSPLWDAGGNDGYPAIADLDQDGTPEVILVASGEVRVLNGETGQAWCGSDPTDAACQADPSARVAPVALPGGGLGGPPTVADFDGDGRPEIAAAGGSSYSVYDIARPGEQVVVPPGEPTPAAGSLYVRWSQPTQDQSSNATGSSVFDFQGDGVAEVIYADECYVRVYSGVDGTVLLEEPNSTGTIHEYPVVVDVDDDGNSEILVVANESHGSCNHIPGYQSRRGVIAYGDTFDQWVSTRRVWTSHTYHVTNATSAGHVPLVEADNWLDPDLNNYRQNVQGEGVFNAPDLTVELAAGLSHCLELELEIQATVRNLGSLGVPAGIEVTLHEGTNADGPVVGTLTTDEPLLPGAQTMLVWSIPLSSGSPEQSYFAAVDSIGEGPGQVLECDESNNSASALAVACPNVG
ncbi:MAG: FG-GAP-like repeat-containing protein [Myxococcota bacterium]